MAGTGGKRPGAGRKSKEIKELKKNWATAILSDQAELTKWKKHLESDDQKISLEALKYLSDQKHGKASQSMVVAGDEKKPLGLLVQIRHIGASHIES